MIKYLKKSIAALGILLILWLAGSLFGSFYATRTRFIDIPPAETYFSQAAENIDIQTIDKVRIKAWWIPNDSSKISVILLNGIGANRSTMVDRAKIYLAQGFNVLLPDLRGTGESGGKMITFGWKERLDLMACYLFLQEKGFDEIGVHGLSLGAATIAYSLELNPRYLFVVLESPYDNIEHALNNRLEIYHIPKFLASIMISLTEGRIEATEEQLSPEFSLRALNAPTLLMAGDSEQKVKKPETEMIFSRIGSNKKQLHFFKGAKHEDFLKRYKKEYTEILRGWLKTLNLKSM